MNTKHNFKDALNLSILPYKLEIKTQNNIYRLLYSSQKLKMSLFINTNQFTSFETIIIYKIQIFFSANLLLYINSSQNIVFI